MRFLPTDTTRVPLPQARVHRWWQGNGRDVDGTPRPPMTVRSTQHRPKRTGNATQVAPHHPKGPASFSLSYDARDGFPCSVKGSFSLTTTSSTGPSDSAVVGRAMLFADPDRLAPRLSPDGDMVTYLAPHDGALNGWVQVSGGAARPVTGVGAGGRVGEDRKSVV